jgi:dTDP-glucose pyrophosphorylase
LNESGLQIVLVVRANGVLLGTLTDGDIRRGLLRGLALSEVIDPILNHTPLVAPTQIESDVALRMMHANKVHQLPVVDAEGRVVGLHRLDELQALPSALSTMVIMAGGKGIRLRPHTENCPKPMILVGGKPILEHIIVQAREEGFQKFVIAIHYLGNIIEGYFADGAKWGVQIDYLREREPLGTGGALSLLHRPNVPFLVTNGDVLTDIRYSELLDFHKRHRATATMAVRPYEWQHPFGVVHSNGMDIIGFEEKPIFRSYVNAGIYVFEPSAVDVLEANTYCDMPTLFERLGSQSERTIVFPMHEPWLDVGRPEDLEQARTAHAPSTH